MIEVLGIVFLTYLILTFFVAIYYAFTEELLEGESRLEVAILVAFTWPLAFYEFLKEKINED